MSIPQFDELMNPTIEALRSLGGKAHVQDIADKVAEILSLKEHEINEIHRGSRSKLDYRLAWSRNYLKRYGILENIGKGLWVFTSKGSSIKSVDIDDVKNTVKNYIDYQSSQVEEEILEIESNDESDLEPFEDIISPFDPKDIKIVVEPKTIDHLVARLRHNEIDLNTEFQRKGNLWKPDVQSRLIESILLRLPLPAFYFDAEFEDKWLVVDGLQRLWTIKNFIVNSEKVELDNPPLELTGLEILVDYSDVSMTFDKLNRSMQRRILETPITTYLIQPGTPKAVKYNVFRRINTGGLGLNSMEIRNALNQGKPSNFLKDLSENENLRKILKLQDKRMEDRELLLRAYSFIYRNYEDYHSPLSAFLDKAMESLSKKTKSELNDLAIAIISSIEFQERLFGKHKFSRSIIGQNNRVKLNSALFEVWVSEIYKLSEEKRNTLLDNKEDFIEDYKELFLDSDFVRSVATSTSGKRSVEIRFQKIKYLINSYCL